MMRRSICQCEPQVIPAGEVGTWRFIHTTAVALPKGTRIRFDLQSKGREIDWEVPTTQLKATSNVIYAHLEDGKPIAGHEVKVADSFTPHFEFTLPKAVAVGGIITIVIGAPKGQERKPNSGNTAQKTIQRRKPFLLYIDPKGSGNYKDKEPEVFSLDVKGNKLHHLRVLAPSLTAKNKRFDITVRFEDQFGNLTSNAPEGTLISLTYDQLRESLSWKLFVPETGFVTLPNLYFNEAGIYKLKLTNLKTKEVFISAPIKCFPDTSVHLFWGLLHGESERIDSTENIENCLRHFRDDQDLHFFASSSFESQEETSAEMWKQISHYITEFNEAERFSTFLGFQWQGEQNSEGLRHFIWTKDAKPILRQKDAKFSTLQKIYKSHSPKELISIPSFTMGSKTCFDFEDFSPEFERVVEIYNAWGSSECTEKEGNPRPIRGSGKAGMNAAPAGSIQNALKKNLRFGFVAGGLDDRGTFADFYNGQQVQYSPGITAIATKDLSRESLAAALQARSCYATTGERIILGLFVAGEPMGRELSTSVKPGLTVNRYVSGYVVGTTELQTVEIIRNGKVLKSYTPKSDRFDFEYDDMEELASIVLEGGEGRPAFLYYYLRVTQKDSHMAWSSPIWVDCPNVGNSSAKKRKKE